MEEALIAAGVGLIAIGLLLALLGALKGAERGRVEAGAVVLLGPIPIVVGTSHRAALLAATAALLLALALLLLKLS